MAVSKVKEKRMDSNFWLQKWRNQDIGFHEGQSNPLLVEYFQQLQLPAGSRVLVPLCGKTRDIAWLLANGYRVAGVELAQMAIDQLFDELGMAPRITPRGELLHYRAANIDIFVGNIFDVSAKVLGEVDGIYDRAALVALPEPMRNRYTAHLMALTNQAPQLLLCLEYDQSQMNGPPFSIDAAEVARHYGACFVTTLLTSQTLADPLKGKCPAKENAWLLQKS